MHKGRCLEIENFKKIVEEKWLKIVGIVVVCLAIDLFFHMLFPMKTETYGLELSIIVKTMDIRVVAGIYLLICFGLIAMIFVLIQENLAGTGIVKGLSYGIAIAALWFFGFIELVVIYNSPLLDELTNALCDIVPIMILGLLLGKYVATDNDDNQIEQPGGRKCVIVICIMSLFFIIGRYFSYTVVNIESGILINPIETFFWTLSLGLWIGIMYFLLEKGLKGKTLIKRSLFFGGILFGINWCIYTLFWPLLFDISLFETFLRISLDILYIIIGTYVVERFFSK